MISDLVIEFSPKTIHENPSRSFIDTTYIDLARFLPKLLDGTKNN